MRKNTLRKSEYRLSAMSKPDQWVKLKRSDAKGGLEFAPLRYVLKLTS